MTEQVLFTLFAPYMFDFNHLCFFSLVISYYYDECTIFIHRKRTHIWQLCWATAFALQINNDVKANVSKNDLSVLNTPPHFSSQQIKMLNLLNKNSGTVLSFLKIWCFVIMFFVLFHSNKEYSLSNSTSTEKVKNA